MTWYSWTASCEKVERTEPTAWSLVALRKCARAGLPVEVSRLNEGEMVLADRCCETGGWNYGNSNMLGKELRPYVPTTALHPS